jgi:enoyl-CoA hydratase/carnithine racemase
MSTFKVLLLLPSASRSQRQRELLESQPKSMSSSSPTAAHPATLPRDPSSAGWVQVTHPTPSICLITMNRPKQANAMHGDVFLPIRDAFEAAAQDKRVKAVILTGRGPFFSTGADVQEMAQSMMAGEIQLISDRILHCSLPLTRTLIQFPKLAIAALNGPAAGFAAASIPLFDVVFTTEKGSLLLPFMQLGINPETASSLALSNAIGHQQFMNLLLTGRPLSSQELIRLGIAHPEVLPDGEQFIPSILSRLQPLLDATPISSILSSKNLMRSLDLRSKLLSAAENEFKLMNRQIASGEMARAFLAKQKEMKSRPRDRKPSSAGTGNISKL